MIGGVVDYREELNLPGSTLEFEVQRARNEPGRTFSADALDHLLTEIRLWIGTRIMRQWNVTEVPPTRLAVTVKVVVDDHAEDDVPE